jgi:hypothetical protein
MYEMKVPEFKIGDRNNDDDNDDGNTNDIRYKRYKLSDRKTFQSLFFPQKNDLLSLIDDFSSRSGKYAIPGYPHKLGILLYGPPGTGKTSTTYGTRRTYNFLIGTSMITLTVMIKNNSNCKGSVGQQPLSNLVTKDAAFRAKTH